MFLSKLLYSFALFVWLLRQSLVQRTIVDSLAFNDYITTSVCINFIDVLVTYSTTNIHRKYTMPYNLKRPILMIFDLSFEIFVPIFPSFLSSIFSTLVWAYILWTYNLYVKG